jgi:hypothetical protein
MPRKKVSQKELPGFLEKLEEAGATHIRRSAANVHGTVMVRWERSAAEEEEYRANVQAWKPVYALHAIFIAAVIALALMALLMR